MRFTTAAQIEKLPTEPIRYDARDTVVLGLCVRVTPTGFKSFTYMYRVKGERLKRRITLGTVGTIDLAAARILAKGHALTAAGGANPGDALKARKQRERDTERAKTEAATEPTVAELGIAYLAAAKLRNAPTTTAEYARQWAKHVLPAIGTRKVSAVAPRDVALLHSSLHPRPILANRVVVLVAAFFSWCEQQGIRPKHSNPAEGITRNKERRRVRRLTAVEETRLMRALDAAALTGNPHTIGAIRFLTLTGWRCSEALSLQWDYLTLDDPTRAVAHLPKTKTGQSTRVLSTVAVALLKALPRTVGHPHVFESPAHAPNPKHPKRTVAGGRARQNVSTTPPARRLAGLHPIVSVDRAWTAIRAAAELKNFRLHDLRHSVISKLLESGASLAEVQQLVGHLDPTTTLGYAHALETGQRVAIEKHNAGMMDAATRPETPVIPITRKQQSVG